MSFEKYFNFFEDYEKGVTIRPQKSAEFKFAQKINEDKKILEQTTQGTKIRFIL